MKKVLSLTLITALTTIIFYSCADDSQSALTDDNSKNKLIHVDNKIVEYYNNDFSIGETINIENQNIQMTSLKSTYQESPIGYMVTDINTGKLLTFIDINITKNEVTIIDNIKGINAVSNTFFDDNKINKKEKFDLIEIIKNSENIDNTAGKARAFGWECHPGSCSTCIECCYYVLWVSVICQDTDFAI